MDRFIVFLERQENTSLSFLAEVVYDFGEPPFFALSHEGLFTNKTLDEETEGKIIEALAPQPGEEIIVTFTRRKSSHDTL
jgi:hypothetical protein